MNGNFLLFGDNLPLLRDQTLFANDSLDLIYLDPPFNSQQSYQVLFQETPGELFKPPQTAFEDTWRWDEQATQALRELKDAAPDEVRSLIQGFEIPLRKSATFAYLVQMTVRLLELYRVLKTTGSLYLHCDPAAGHYLRVILDSIFGARNFRREIVWRSGWVSGFKTRTQNWVRNHDLIFYFVKDIRADYAFNKQYLPHRKGYRRRLGRGNPQGIPLEDVWTDVYSPWVVSFSREKLGFRTQKPRALLERIIRASSNSGDVILDPFCGSGTTSAAVETLNREFPLDPPRIWIGIDQSAAAIEITRRRLARLLPPAEYKFANG